MGWQRVRCDWAHTEHRISFHSCMCSLIFFNNILLFLMYKSCISFLIPSTFKVRNLKFWEIECKWLSNASLFSLWWKLCSLLQYMQTILPWFSRTTKRMIWHCFPGDPSDEELTCQWRRSKRCGFDPWVWNIPGRRAWQPTLAYFA